MRDGTIKRLQRAAGEASSVRDELDRAAALFTLAALAEEAAAASVREANVAGYSWRQLGAHLGVPYQTLHRRYGGEG